MKTETIEAIRQHLIEHGALELGCDCHERRAIVEHVAEANGSSTSAVYGHLRALRQGDPPRKPRSDKGKPRTWPPEAVEVLRRAVIERPFLSAHEHRAMLEAEFPNTKFSVGAVYHWLRRVRDTIDEETDLPRLRVWSPEHIRFLQTVAGHSDAAVAAELSIAPAEWRAAVEGKYPLPATLVPILAWVFGVPVGDLFVEEAATHAA